MMPPTTIPAGVKPRWLNDRFNQPTMIRPGDLFTVRGRPYTTFEFGTNADSSMSYGYCRWPRTWADTFTPVWAFAHAAVIASTPQPKPHIKFELEPGSLVLVPEYGWYTLQLAANNNVRFVAVS